MKKKITLCIFFMAAFVAFAQTDTANINKTDRYGKKQGIWKKYEQGKLVYTGQFKDDVPYGEFKYYHKNGNLKSTTNFLQGVHKVSTTIFYENGKKASEGQYVDYIKNGEWNYYSQNDILIKTENYANGKRNGVWKTFSSETGILLEECNYLNDKRNGVFKTFYVNGNPSLEENYVSGKTNGKSTAYYPNGNISVTGNYHIGHRDGEWHYYDVNGKIRTTWVYENKMLKNTYIYLYQKGVGQRLNQATVAYFVKKRDKVSVVLKNGNSIDIDEKLEDVEGWVDFTDFIKVNPRYIVATDALVSYKNVEDDNEAIIVKIQPTPDEEIYSEGTEAKFIKALFNTAKPVQ